MELALLAVASAEAKLLPEAALEDALSFGPRDQRFELADARQGGLLTALPRLLASR